MYLDHVLTALNYIFGQQGLNAGIASRENLLKDVECVPDVGMNADDDGKSNWVLIEESGEEAEEPQSNWHFFTEENIVGILQRIPFQSMLTAISKFIQCNPYQNFLPCVAYFNHLIQTFTLCFQNFALNRYSALRKRVADYCVKFTNFAINTYLESIFPASCDNGMDNDDPQPPIDEIKIEVDALLLRVFAVMINYYKDESIVSLLPRFYFVFLFSSTAWKVVYLILGPYHGAMREVEHLLQYTEDPTNLFTDGLNDFSELDRKFDQVSFESGAAILTTLTNIIKDTNFKDEQLMIYVLNSLFYITYVSAQHKYTYFKYGHDLVCYLLTSHVNLVTFYLNKINRNWEKMSSCSNNDGSANGGNKLMLEMNLDHWVPTNSDIELLLHWLESYEVTHSLNILSRKILSFVDWQAKDLSGERLIPFAKQSRVIGTILLVYSNVVNSETYDVPTNVKLCSYASQKATNASYATPVGTSVQSPTQLFASWAWKMVIIMHATGDILNFKAEELKSVAAVNGAKNSLLTDNAFLLHTFTALASCDDVNHEFSLSNGGLQLLRELSSQMFVKPSLYILFWNLEFELTSFESLFRKKADFVQILVNICQSDSNSIVQKIGFGLTSSVGANTFMLSSMLISFLQTCLVSHGVQSAQRVVEFIVASIFLHPNFSSNFYLLYLLEKICYFAFNSFTLRQFLYGYFFKLLKEIQNSDVGGGKNFKVFSSIKYFTPLPTSRTYPEFGFLSYFSLVGQILFEDENKMWEKLIERLFKDLQTAGLGAVLKELYLSDKWPVCLSETSLSIYMLGDLILFLQHDHPALPLICQLFFSRFFYRLDPNKSVYENTSLGDRFYSNFYYKGTFAKFKARFEEMIASATCSKTAADSPEAEIGGGGREQYCMTASSSYDIEAGLSNAPTVSKYCRAFILWIEETKLHTASIVIAKLPEKFMPAALTNIIAKGVEEPLEDFCLQVQMTSEVMKSMKTWHEEVFSCFNKTVVVLEHFDFTVQAAIYRNERLKNHFDYQDYEMPAVEASQVPRSSIDKSLLISNRSLMEYFARCYSKVQDYAQLQVNCTRELLTDFEKYCELTPQQFENKLTSVQTVMQCESSLFHRSACTGPVVFDLSYSCKTENLTATFELERIWKKMLEAVEKEPTCQVQEVYVVQVMHEVIEALVKLSKSEVNYTDAQIARSNAVDLFFLLANLTSESTLCFAPLKQTVKELMHRLGEEVVMLSGENQAPLLDLMLTKPYLLEMLHCFFAPEHATPSSPGTFCTFYQKLVSKITSSSSSPFDERLPDFLLPKFDVDHWIVKTKPSPTVKCSLLHCMFDLFSFIGPSPAKDHFTMFNSVKQQMFQLVQTDFASEFPPVFLSIISLTAAQKASRELWTELTEMSKLKTLQFNCCGVAANEGCGNGSEGLAFSSTVTQSEFESKQLYTLVAAFQSCDFVSNIAQSLNQIKANNLETPLLVLLNPHISFFSKFLFLLSKIVAHSVYEISAAATGTVSKDAKEAESKCEQVWSVVTQLYSPFIAPFIVSEERIVSPKAAINAGSSAEEDSSDTLFDMLCDSFSASVVEVIKYERSMTHYNNHFDEGRSSSLYIDNFLTYLKTVLIVQDRNKDSQLSELMTHYFKSFLKLPWLNFVPTVRSVDIMLQLLEADVSYSPDVKEFVAQVFLYMDWCSYCKMTSSIKTQSASCALHRFLLLSVFLETSSELSESSIALVIGRLDKMQDLKLHKLTPDHFNVLLSIFFKLIAKKNRAAVGTTNERREGLCLKNPFGVFRLLLDASHLNKSCSNEEESTVNGEKEEFDMKERQRMFEYKLTFMEHVCKKSLLVDAVEPCNEVVACLLSFVSECMDSRRDPASAILHLFAPIVQLINSYSFDQQSNACIEGFRKWAEQPSNHSYLSLFAVSCCQNLANVESLAHFLEIVCEAYFTLSSTDRNSNCDDYTSANETSSQSQCSWQLLSNSFDLPYSGKAEFEVTCSKKCFYFVLDIQARQETPRAVNPEVKLAQLFTWLNEAKNLTTANEAKAFLIFSHCFMALEKLIKDTTNNSSKLGVMSFIEKCRTFMSYLQELSEDRSSSGLCGMIGLGAVSKLSKKFRVCCKCLLCFLQIQIEQQTSLSNATQPDGGENELLESISSSSKFASSETLLNNLKVYSVAKDYPNIAAGLQNIVTSILCGNSCRRSDIHETTNPNADPTGTAAPVGMGVAQCSVMNGWNELMQKLVSTFYPNSYNFKVLLNYQ